MRASLFSILALVGAVVVSACGSSGSSNNGGSSSGGGGSSGSSSGGSSGGGSGSSSGAVPLDAAAPDGDIITTPDAGGGTSAYTVQFGPITVPAGTENTQCIVVPLGNTASIHVGQIHDLLGTASHHMILYKVASTTMIQTTPIDCQPFQGALNPANGNPLIISQKADDTLTLPQGVAFTLDPNQLVRLEMHYINANTMPVTLVTTSTLTTIPDAAYKYDASFLFIGDPQITIPPNATYTTGEQYFALPAQYNSSNFFAITGHEHHLGTEVQIWNASQGASSAGSLIYTSTSWSDPPVTTFTPPFQIPAGGGFKFQCKWDNTTSSQVNFGESANDEMCFFWAYYFPSQGASVCFTASGLSACCPGASPLCSQF